MSFAVNLRVSNITRETRSTRPNAESPPSPPENVAQVTLIPAGSAFEVLGGQKLILYFHEGLPRDVGIDAVLELRVVASSVPTEPPAESNDEPEILPIV